MNFLSCPKRLLFKSVLGLTAGVFLGWSPRLAGQSQTPFIIPHIDRGAIQGKTYQNTSIGLAFTPDPSLTFQHPDLRESGKKGESLMVAALAKATRTVIREGIFLGVVALADYPQDQRSTDSCMRKVEDAQLKNDFKTMADSPNNAFGHMLFARSDFSRKNPTAYEIVFVKACNAVAFTIVFAGRDRDTAERFIAATDVRLDPSASGCR